jgi:hypothetical protein
MPLSSIDTVQPTGLPPSTMSITLVTSVWQLPERSSPRRTYTYPEISLDAILDEFLSEELVMELD